MHTNPDISVIIPAYNVEAWITRAIESLQAQTLYSFEVLLVDDGSTDGTGAVCDRLAERDARIRVIHQQNAGAAAARNNAMKVARGTYWYFMDGDDWCEPTMLADLFAAAEQDSLELVVTGFYIDTYYGDNEFYREQRTAPACVYASQADFRAHAVELFDAQLLYAPWNKLYKASYLKERGIEFPATFWDDLPFNVEVVRQVARVGCVDGRYYHFLRARAESENTKYRADMYAKREEEHVWLTELFAQWGEDTPQVREFLARRYAERLVGCVENVANPSCALPIREKKAEVARMISTPQAREALAEAAPRTALLRAMLAPCKWGNATLTLWEGRFISWVKRHNTNLFARLKANR